VRVGERGGVGGCEECRDISEVIIILSGRLARVAERGSATGVYPSCVSMFFAVFVFAKIPSTRPVGQEIHAQRHM